jgi:hypothetical protein
MFQATLIIHICSDVTAKRFRPWTLLSGVFYRLLHVNDIREAGTEIFKIAHASLICNHAFCFYLTV